MQKRRSRTEMLRSSPFDVRSSMKITSPTACTLVCRHLLSAKTMPAPFSLTQVRHGVGLSAKPQCERGNIGNASPRGIASLPLLHGTTNDSIRSPHAALPHVSLRAELLFAF